MSKKVDLARLADTLRDYGFAYVISVDDRYTAHTAAVTPQLNDGVLHVGAVGRHTRANVEAHPDVTLLWPPQVPGGYSLIVDGHATGTDPLTVAPTRAVLHRPVTVDSPPSTCSPAYDCVDLATQA
ncbi:hypothetical protein [Mycobacterium talmoniae]|uniref:Pyridoxamine 5'-phosphate oxidase putative domain-containing protein n=1 Tax=Mycobacterium talmoniae TaxID=1858794 RepID=A0A1S1NJ25_9MYCO|nr:MULTISPECIES: hypothetical protein [Mycobacterium]OHV03858.1 hypothetical protein BKN37_12880 [Mycobacterium talmoniae]PQM45021.1 hypothetical protein C1Y40_04829 [Mycobacterium talmoniae]TDH56228.1 pyridoxamine 5'-phosphate oxidase family protein [Mycobacterium eburneum]